MSKNKKEKILKELKKIDKELVSLILKRSELLDKYLKKKMKQGKSISDSDLEKDLWKMWSSALDKGLDEKLLRRVFNYINWMGYELKREEISWNFILNPSNIPVDINIFGPRDRISSRFWTILYAGAKTPFKIEHIVLNDKMHDLLKALNLANGDFSWTKDKIVFEAKRNLNFEQRPIFVGDDELNLYLLVFLSLSTSGKFKFTGGNRLKILNLDPLFKVLSQLGARGVSLVPYSEGLPIRIEASGLFNDTLVLPDQADIKLISSLILCSVFYKTSSGFIKIVSSHPFDENMYLCRVFDIFKNLNINVEKRENEIVIFNPDNLKLPQDLDIFLDPVLSGFILTFPQAVGGKATLQGRFPLWLDEGRNVLDILLSSDLYVDVFEDRVESAKKTKKPSYFIKSYSEHLFPLALGIGCLCEPEAIVKLEGAQDFNLLDKLDLRYEVREDLLYLYNEYHKSFPKVEVDVQDPILNMTLSLISFKRPYISLTNPGNITEIWPQYWNIFKSLPKCRSWDIEEEKKSETTRRRILVG